VNQVLRTGLAHADQPEEASEYRLRPASMGAIASGVDSVKLLALADRLNDEQAVEEMRERK